MLVNFAEDHPISQLYYKTLQRTQLPTTCYWKYGQNATDLRHVTEPKHQHYTAEKNVTTGNEKNHVTVLLACAGDGSKLRSLVIFKRKEPPKRKAGWMPKE